VQTLRNPSEKSKLTRCYKKDKETEKLLEGKENFFFIPTGRPTAESLPTGAGQRFHLDTGGVTTTSG
jgi:hypothetical protein